MSLILKRFSLIPLSHPLTPLSCPHPHPRPLTTFLSHAPSPSSPRSGAVGQQVRSSSAGAAAAHGGAEQRRRGQGSSGGARKGGAAASRPGSSRGATMAHGGPEQWHRGQVAATARGGVERGAAAPWPGSSGARWDGVALVHGGLSGRVAAGQSNGKRGVAASWLGSSGARSRGPYF
ncbi:hypothetical protein PVAP13_3KG425601 [Panicum virgatum]|uniref:Uncharacterized protein n=1 Tax=Panicum virgatum TaxID=38727 RepID=A0A8T0V4D3_PANVG|nr:hypothetical protein PVAP13_3KG425601 [Panicum virgatum]